MPYSPLVLTGRISGSTKMWSGGTPSSSRRLMRPSATAYTLSMSSVMPASSRLSATTRALYFLRNGIRVR